MENTINSSFKKKLWDGDLLVGTILTLSSTEIAEILCMAGFDWLFVDLEHGAMSFIDAQKILQAVQPQVPCLVRVPANEETWIKKALDIGADGIIVPQVQTADEARRAVQLCKFPPEGTRSVGIARAHGYGDRFKAYLATANDRTAVILQIEDIRAVNNIEAIVKVSGIDGLFIGPYDLSASMGKTGLTTDPEVEQAISRVTRCARQASIPLGIFGATVEAVQPYIQQGYCLIAVGIDTMLMGTAAKAITLGFEQ